MKCNKTATKLIYRLLSNSTIPPIHASLKVKMYAFPCLLNDAILRNIERDTGVQQDTLSAHWLGLVRQGSLCAVLFLTACPGVNHEVNSLAIYSPVLFNLLCKVIWLLTGLNSKCWIVQHKTKWHRCPNQYILVLHCKYTYISHTRSFPPGLPERSWSPARLHLPTLIPPARGWNH